MEHEKESILTVIEERLEKLDGPSREIAAAYIEGMAANEERHRRMKEETKATA